MIHEIGRAFVVPAIAGFLSVAAGVSHAAGSFGAQSMTGEFVISADGGFVAMTPFSASPLRLNVSLIGRLWFDGDSRAYGEWTIAFHHAAVPFTARSHFETVGTYEVTANGRMVMEFEEFKVEPPAQDDGIADGIVGFECYIVQRQQEARCILNSLTSLQQGPEPVPEPVTMSGILLRQN